MALVETLGRRLRPLRGLPTWACYAATIALVLGAYLLRLALDDVYHYPFATFVPAILAAALLFGHGSGLLATVLAAAVAPRFFAAPGGQGIGGPEAMLALAAFVALGLLTAAMIEALGTAAARLAEANARLAEANRRLARAERAAREGEARSRVLLGEVNHRLKNSLQGVGGALSAEGRRVDSLAARAAIEGAALRLSALGRLHERLHLLDADPAAEARIDLRDYLMALCDDLRTSLIGERAGTTLRMRAEAVEIEATRAALVGLILNEAVTNALRHAFPDGRGGAVTARLERDGAGWLRLEVADDGVGAGGAEDGGGTGTRLIDALARQLGGSVERHGPPGTRVVARFREARDGEVGGAAAEGPDAARRTVDGGHAVADREEP
jgi:two-component sensor histidine kinase